MTRMTENAQSASDFADEGRKRFTEGGDPTGVAQQLLGAAGWLTSPLSALVPHGAESSLPEGAQPFARAGMDLADIFMPGPGEMIQPAMLLGVMAKNPEMMRKLPQYYKEMQQGRKSENTLSFDNGGWFLDKDLQPKYEISDHRAAWKPEMDDVISHFLRNPTDSRVAEMPLSSVFSHPEYQDRMRDTFAAYKLRVHNDPNERGLSGYQSPGAIGLYLPSVVRERNGAGVMELPDPEDPKWSQWWQDSHSTMLHELNHVTSAAHPGWARGTNPDWVRGQILHAQGDTSAYNSAVDALYAHTAIPFGEEYQKLAGEYGTPTARAYSDFRSALTYPTLSKANIAKMLRGFEGLTPEAQAFFEPKFRSVLAEAEPILNRTHYSPEEARAVYMNNLDEANSRTVEARAGMGDFGQRAEYPFWEHRDEIVGHDNLTPFWDPNQPKKKNQQAKIDFPFLDSRMLGPQE